MINQTTNETMARLIALQVCTGLRAEEVHKLTYAQARLLLALNHPTRPDDLEVDDDLI